jgi:hypothetical protein
MIFRRRIETNKVQKLHLLMAGFDMSFATNAQDYSTSGVNRSFLFSNRGAGGWDPGEPRAIVCRVHLKYLR